MTNGKSIEKMRTFAKEKIGQIDGDALLKNVLSCDEIYLLIRELD